MYVSGPIVPASTIIRLDPLLIVIQHGFDVCGVLLVGLFAHFQALAGLDQFASGPGVRFHVIAAEWYYQIDPRAEFVHLFA